MGSAELVLTSGGVHRPSPWRLPAGPVARATALGSCSILLWALWPALAVTAMGVPPFQLLTVAFACAFALFVSLRLHRGQPPFGLLAAPPAVLGAGLLGVLGSNIFYIFALRLIPAAEANIVAYTWPVMIVGLSALLGWLRPAPRHWVGLGLGFAGAAVIIGPTSASDGVPLGYLLALGSGLSWALYSLARTRLPGGPADVIGGVCGLAAPFCLLAHLLLEGTTSRSTIDLMAAAAIGFGPIGGANALWDYGISRGDAGKLAVFAYATPLLATVLLVTLGLVPLDAALVIGGILVIAGAVLASSRDSSTKRHQ